ncbi:PREDICTED: uncharacterized protein LOC106814652 [Priapulus caudatus]|uniref:Uncharacterized protein LOC106814652 n=1 Tax=Priapulus caudatus TaxID=37621 RepID=A0ABM1EQK9_PRICU|nr:PREDICTED: uncharacterized protein LOC106814652 [Priapulus caudatus]XP_014674481.1 PREDICTED: uncharacterized protein LOC106814652 [Priapulus caudatus]XP_014674482.1 PREDICTED: uncharacterized protein LOC106814652 [Priapulus caudatus]XP_014674483.1 PREDICTED: uncharacterized protein LOC106814652 [Priapulus caudatus]
MPWAEVKQTALALVKAVEEYCVFLRSQNVRVKVSQAKPQSEVEVKANVTILRVNQGPVHHLFSYLDRQVSATELYQPISVREHLPPGMERRRVYDAIEDLKQSGLKSHTVHHAHHIGGSKESLHFVWRIEPTGDPQAIINGCLKVKQKIEADAPVFERRITKREFMRAYGFVSQRVALRSIFKNLTGDQSAAHDTDEKAIDKRFQVALLCEDPGIVVDLRTVKLPNQRDTFATFFAETERYLSEEVGVAVQERRHGEQLYLAKAVSLNDLHRRVQERVPPGIKIPSVKWMRYQFEPINSRANTAKYYKAEMKIKMMVQKRQVGPIVFNVR